MTLLACKVLAPWLEVALVEGISLSAYLEDNRIAAETLEEGDTVCQEFARFITRA